MVPNALADKPSEKRISVLVLEGGRYRTDGEYRPDETARSRLLEIDVAAMFAAGEPN
jgi:hypothetical protein